jgi:undecaprenyl-diphosphatase
VLLAGLGAAAVLGGLALAVSANLAGVERVDTEIHAWALRTRDDWSIALARGLSYVGAGRVTLPALLVVGALAPRGPRPWPTRLGAGAMLAGLAALGGGLGVMLNRALDNPRPPVQDWAGAAVGGSFPSGHTTTATLFAAACVGALLGRVRSRGGRIALIGVAAAFALGVGWSRVWLGVHWPTDVLGGLALALAWSTLAAGAALAVVRTRMGREGLRQVDQADVKDLHAERRTLARAPRANGRDPRR